MSVAGYEKVKTKVIEGKKKCIYKKYKGTKLYVKGFGKMRSVESYIKLCKKAAAKSAKSAKPMKTKKTRSKTTRKYGGFLQEFFTNLEQMDAEEGKDLTKKSANKTSTSAASAAANGEAAVKQHFNNAMPTPASPAPPATTPPVEMMSQKMGGGSSSSSCSRQGGNRGGYRGGNTGLGQLFNAFGASGGYRGGQSLDQFQDQDDFNNQTDQFQDQTGGRRRKRRKTPKSMLDKLMMAANFGKRSAKKGKKLRRKGGNALADSANVLGAFTDSLTKGGKKKKAKRNGVSSQFDY